MAAPLAVWGAAGAAGADRGSFQAPNVLLIVADDQAWTDYSFMGHPAIQTPHLDRLAREGLAFTRGYVPSSLCCPSLASLVTGRYPHQHRITSNDPPIPSGMSAAEFHQSAAFLEGREVMNRHLDGVPTLPRRLAEFGYLSLQTGKWWQGHFSRGGFTRGMTRGARHGDEGLEIGRQTLRPILDFMAEARAAARPFFIWYAPMMPHDPHTPPERLLARHRGRAPSLSVARYWAMVEWFDETVGVLLDQLDQQGLASDTLVVYLADNGWIQDARAERYAPRSKQSPYEAGLRTPILIRWPGRVRPGRSAGLAQSIDVVPTILAALGCAPDAGLPGINLLDAEAVRRRRRLFGECFTHDARALDRPASNLRWRWVLDGRWKLIVPDPDNEPDGVVELYDVLGDPWESHNRALAMPRRVARLRRALDAWWDPARELRDTEGSVESARWGASAGPAKSPGR